MNPTKKHHLITDNHYFKADVFSNPKPIELISYFLSFCINNNDIVLDFFSGSGTTADALFRYNLSGSNCKFILVQIPEKINSNSLSENGKRIALNALSLCNDIGKPPLLTEVAKERIRRAGKKNKEEHPEAKDLDTGFRVLKCDESNMKDVYFSPKELQQGMLDFMEDNIKDDRSDLDLLFDCMLRWGVELSLPMTTTQVDGCTIHNVNDGDLLACFAGTITDKVISAIASQHPLRIVFRDSSFTSASQKMNLFEQFKQLLSWSDQEVRNNVKVI